MYLEHAKEESKFIIFYSFFKMRTCVYTNLPDIILLFAVTFLCKHDTGVSSGTPSLNVPSWTSSPASPYLTELISHCFLA